MRVPEIAYQNLHSLVALSIDHTTAWRPNLIQHHLKSSNQYTIQRCNYRSSSSKFNTKQSVDFSVQKHQLVTKSGTRKLKLQLYRTLKWHFYLKLLKL